MSIQFAEESTTGFPRNGLKNLGEHCSLVSFVVVLLNMKISVFVGDNLQEIEVSGLLEEELLRCLEKQTDDRSEGVASVLKKVQFQYLLSLIFSDCERKGVCHRW